MERAGVTDCLAVHSTKCSSRGLWLDSQHPHDASKASLTPVSGDLMLSSGLQGHFTHSAQTYTQAKHP